MSEENSGRAWLRRVLSLQADPYEEGDRSNSRRIGAMLWIVLAALIVLILPLSPPDDELGEGGWLLAVFIVALISLWVALLRSTTVEVSWAAQLLAGYLGVGMVALLQWTSGGSEAPFAPLILLIVLYVAVMHPRRQVLYFMAAVAAALAAPLMYENASRTDGAEALITFIIWSGIAFLTTAVMGVLRDQRRGLRISAETAREEARKDSLTGLPNRRAFDEALETEIRRASRLGVPLSVVMVDIANFKRINDIWGAAQGDETLRRTATALRGEMRRPDCLFRWGGDEFALILSGTDAEGARDAAERLRAAIASSLLGPDEEPIRIRHGVAEMREGTDGDALIENVGLSLSAAKAALTTDDARSLYAAARDRVRRR